MDRSSTFRSCLLLTSFVVAASGVIASVDVRPSSRRDRAGVAAMAATQPMGQRHRTVGHSPAHGGGPGQESDSDCPCFGLCGAGATPSSREGGTPTDDVGLGGLVRERPRVVTVIRGDPRLYLHPFPNGPPSRA